jgi:hypothetical protein
MSFTTGFMAFRLQTTTHKPFELHTYLFPKFFSGGILQLLVPVYTQV